MIVSALFNQRAGETLDAGQGRWNPEKEKGFSQQELIVWLEWAAVNAHALWWAPGERSSSVHRGGEGLVTERGLWNATATVRSLPPHPRDKLLGSWLSQPRLKPPISSLRGGDIPAGLKAEMGRLKHFAFRGRSLISSGSASISLCPRVNCSFGFCGHGSWSRLGEAGSWRVVFSDRETSLSFVIYGVFKYGILFAVGLITPLLYFI